MFLQTVCLADKVLRGTEELDGTQILSMTIIGLSVVFCALLILVIYLYCSGSLFRRGSKPKAKPEPPKAAPKPAAPPAPVSAPLVQEDDGEVVAVIMAAIAAMGQAEGKTYRLKSVRQVSRSGGSAWSQAGRAENTRPF